MNTHSHRHSASIGSSATEHGVATASAKHEDCGATVCNRSEAEWRDSQEFHHSLVEQLPVGIFRMDAAGRYTFVNSSFCRLAGLRQQDYLGKRSSKIIELLKQRGGSHRDMATFSTGEQHHARIMATGERNEREEQWPLPGGGLQDLLVIHSPVFDVSARIVGSQGILFDITERKRAESGRHESEARFRQLAESIHEVFWLTDPAKSEMLYVSPSYERIWQRTTASLYTNPRQWLEAIVPEDRERVVAATLEKQSRGDYDETYGIARPDGSVRWIRERAFPIYNAAGDVARIAGTASAARTGVKLTVSQRFENHGRSGRRK
ncbi:MAG: PAS domain S-box protein [Opitutaceae bacterium]|nr:PAS domain S-box protein [Opitutaceae bacterium]